VLVLLALASSAVAGCGADDGDCSRSLKPGEWTRIPVGDKRIEAARTLVACRTLVGKTRPEVRRLLGRPTDRYRREWGYGLGYLDSSMGPGHLANLGVYFGGGRVRRATAP
jgi:hypothetical protein